MNNKVVIITSRFTSTNELFDLWWKSAEVNKDFVFFVITDIDIKNKANNIIVKRFNSINHFISFVDKKLGFKTNITTPYKTADLRPAYMDLFEDELAKIYAEKYGKNGNFDFWGFVDTDVILGNLISFVNDNVLNKCDVFQTWGHFMLVRNTEITKKLYKTKYKTYSFSKSLCLPQNCMLEEGPFVLQLKDIGCRIDSKVSRVAGIRRNIFKYSIDWVNYDKQAFVYENNGIFRYYLNDKNQVCIDEFMYIHIMKRKVVMNYTGNKIHMTENGFFDFDKSNPFQSSFSQELYKDWEENTNVDYEIRSKRASILYKLLHLDKVIYRRRIRCIDEEKESVIREFYEK